MSRSTFALLPGAGGDPWYWHRVVAWLQARGHAARAIALPAAQEDAGLPGYAQAVVHALGEPPLPGLVLVAQSLAGFVAPLVCERLPVQALVFVNAMIPVPGETAGAWFERTGQPAAKRAQDLREGRDPDAGFDPLVEFFHDVPQPVIDAAWARGAPRQADRVFGSPCNCGRWPDVPMHVLVGREDRFFPAAFQQQLARERLGLAATLVPGGHLVALSRPEELGRRLLDCLAPSQRPARPARPGAGPAPRSRRARGRSPAARASSAGSGR